MQNWQRALAGPLCDDTKHAGLCGFPGAGRGSNADALCLATSQIHRERRQCLIVLMRFQDGFPRLEGDAQFLYGGKCISIGRHVDIERSGTLYGRTMEVCAEEHRMRGSDTTLEDFVDVLGVIEAFGTNKIYDQMRTSKLNAFAFSKEIFPVTRLYASRTSNDIFLLGGA
jgi:hypothetical protein